MVLFSTWEDTQRLFFFTGTLAHDPDDPLRPERVKELYALTELIKLTKAKRNKLIYEKMDALAREIGELKPRDARRADIVNEIIRLSHLIVK